MKIYKTELEEYPAFDGFSDVFHSFNLLRGKSNGNDDEDESRIYGKFKGSFLFFFLICSAEIIQGTAAHKDKFYRISDDANKMILNGQ